MTPTLTPTLSLVKTSLSMDTSFGPKETIFHTIPTSRIKTSFVIQTHESVSLVSTVHAVALLVPRMTNINFLLKISVHN